VLLAVQAEAHLVRSRADILYLFSTFGINDGPHYQYRLTSALRECRGPLRLPAPAPSLANGSSPAPQSPANASAPEAAARVAAPDAASAAGQTSGTASTADDAQKAVTPDSVMAELVALLSHKDNKASGQVADTDRDYLRTSCLYVQARLF